MKNFPFFIFTSILVILQLSVLGAFFSPLRIPNIILAFVVCLAIRKGFENHLGWIILAGILFDIGTSRLLGSSALLFVLLAFGIDKLNAVSNIQSRRLLFYPSFALVIAISLFLFDWAGIGLWSVEKYFLSAKVVLAAPLRLNADFFWKTTFTVLGGYVAHYFLKKFQTNDSQKLFQQKAAG
ncbi:MAG: rod shape-determining protein MreD [Patescibacteria group bacterium]|nr:rod shape-determining protein MreD [Patescibacteria group bacterium]